MEKKYVTLDKLPEKVKGICYQFNSGRGLMMKLMDRGIFRGTEIERIRGDKGPIVVKLKDTQFMIGYGIARKIIVEYDYE